MNLEDYKDSRDAIDNEFIYSEAKKSISRHILNSLHKECWFGVLIVLGVWSIFIFANYRSTGQVNAGLIGSAIASAWILFYINYITGLLKEILIFLDITLNIKKNLKKQSWD